jgi:hypothetical protein
MESIKAWNIDGIVHVVYEKNYWMTLTRLSAPPKWVSPALWSSLLALNEIYKRIIGDSLLLKIALTATALLSFSRKTSNLYGCLNFLTTPSKRYCAAYIKRLGVVWKEFDVQYGEDLGYCKSWSEDHKYWRNTNLKQSPNGTTASADTLSVYSYVLPHCRLFSRRK